MLTGRYRVGHKFPDDDERARLSRFQGESLAHYVDVADRLKELAADKGISLVQMAIALASTAASGELRAGGRQDLPSRCASIWFAADVTFSSDELARIETILENTPGAMYDS